MMDQERMVDLEDILKVNPQLVSPGSFGFRRVIDEVRWLNDLGYAGKEDEYPAFMLVFTDGTMSQPLTAIRNFASKMPVGSAVECGLLTEQHVRDIEDEEALQASNQKIIAELKDSRAALQRQLGQHGLSSRQTAKIIDQIHKTEQALEDRGITRG
jgi:hypothetical protein